MNSDYSQLFEVNNSSSEAVQKENESIEQSISVTQVQQIENAYADCIGIIMPMPTVLVLLCQTINYMVN